MAVFDIVIVFDVATFDFSTLNIIALGTLYMTIIVDGVGSNRVDINLAIIVLSSLEK